MTSILSDLLPFMDKKYRGYWRAIIDYNYNIQKNKSSNINLFNLLFINIVNEDKLVERNSYLKDEETYNRFKSFLVRSNISFKNVNAIDIPKEFQGKYDVMCLSNIFEYLQHYFSKFYPMDKFIISYIEELMSLMNADGQIFLLYIFDYATRNYTREKIFYGLNLEVLRAYEIFKINSCRKTNMQDGVLVLKK